MTHPIAAVLAVLILMWLAVVIAYAIPRPAQTDPYSAVWEGSESESRAERCMYDGGQESQCILDEMTRSMGK